MQSYVYTLFSVKLSVQWSVSSQRFKMGKIYKKKRGRPATVDKDAVFDLLGRHICDIFHSQSEVLVSKTDSIWTKLSQEFQNRISPSTVYTYACEFKKDLGSHSDKDDEENDENDEVLDPSMKKQDLLSTILQ